MPEVRCSPSLLQFFMFFPTPYKFFLNTELCNKNNQLTQKVHNNQKLTYASSWIK